MSGPIPLPSADTFDFRSSLMARYGRNLRNEEFSNFYFSSILLGLIITESIRMRWIIVCNWLMTDFIAGCCGHNNENLGSAEDELFG
jgi:hypothetical protein